MTKQTLSAHSALTAIAAGLVLASTPALAQVTETAPADAAPAPIVVPSAQPAPAMPGPATTVALPQITAPVATAAAVTAAAPTLPEVEPQRSVRSEPAPARRAAPEERRAVSEARAAPAARPATATPVFTPAPVQTAPVQTAAPVSQIPLVDPTIEQTAPETTATATEPSGNEALWVVGGAGAALLAGVGALVYMSRRRRGEASDGETVYAPIATPAQEPLLATPGFSISPAAPVSPAPATANAQNLTRGDHSDDLEAMAAQAPTQDNPFLTRKSRLRRAEFILERGQAPRTYSEAPQAPHEQATPAKEKARQPVYNFANNPASFRPQGWKPVTT